MNQKKFYPVVHCIDAPDAKFHAASNVNIALANGADGAFLTSDKLDCFKMLEIYNHVRNIFPKAWIGVRFQDLHPGSEAVRLTAIVRKCAGLSAVWVNRLPDRRLRVPESVLVFGSILFDYSKQKQRQHEFKALCAQASDVVDTVTVFGPGKGASPSMVTVGAVCNRLKKIREEGGRNANIAVAGGMHVDNMFKFLPSVDIIIASTHISEQDMHGSRYLVPEKVAHMAKKSHD